MENIKGICDGMVLIGNTVTWLTYITPEQKRRPNVVANIAHAQPSTNLTVSGSSYLLYLLLGNTMSEVVR